MIKKRWISIALLLTFIVLSLIMPSFAQSKPLTEEELRQYNQDMSVQAYQYLNNYLTECANQACMQLDDTGSALAAVYAGAYIDASGNLVVNITDTSENVRKELQTATKDVQIQYRLVKYNLETLNEIYGILSSRLGEAPYFQVVLSETNNTVEVYTEQETNSCIDYISSIADISAVTVIQEKNEFADCATACAGDTLNCIETAQGGTVGFPCTQNSTKKKGIVTAAHVVSSSNSTLGNTIWINEKDFGTVNSTRYGNTVDAAFVLKNQSLLPPWWILKSELPNGDTIHNWCDSSVTPEGTDIRKYGATTGLTFGRVLSNSASLDTNGVVFYALTKTTMQGKPGDSGGPCVTTYQGKNMLVGIVKGRDINQNTYYCKINYIMNELNVTPIVADR